MIDTILWDEFQALDPADRDWFRVDREKRFGDIESYKEGGEEKLVHWRQSLEPLRATLHDQAYLSGDVPAYADYIVFSTFQFARCVGRYDVIGEDDLIQQWCECIMKPVRRLRPHRAGARGMRDIPPAAGRDNPRGVNAAFSRNDADLTPLHKAVQHNDAPWMIDALLDAGGDVNARDKRGKKASSGPSPPSLRLAASEKMVLQGGAPRVRILGPQFRWRESSTSSLV